MLRFEENKIIQTIGDYVQAWSIPELLESHNPLLGEPLAERNEALRQASKIASKMTSELSESARQYINFWEKFRPEKIPTRRFEYASAADGTCSWKLKINALGLFYEDVLAEFSTDRGDVTEQMLSDFWFFGPLRPMPDLEIRREVVSMLKKAFSNPACLAAAAHFELFDYPKKSVSTLHWTESDYHRTDVISVCRHGIEYQCSNWREPIPQAGFLSFENFLNAPLGANALISPKIRAEIEAHLGKTSKHNPEKTADTGLPKPPTPREKMDAAEELLKQPNSAEGSEILISLLEYEAEESYWRNYVFNRFFKLRDNRTVQNFVAQCLQGDNETHFKKAVDVLTMWGIYGDKSLMDRTLLQSLNWADACANDPDFRKALEKAIKIIFQKN